MYAHHKFDHEFPRSAGPEVSYVVCALPRSGSSLLCELLLNTGVAGAPTEFFDRETMDGFRSTWGVHGFDAYVDALLSRKTSPNGVFGFKVHYEQYDELLAGKDLRSLFPNLRFLYTDRRDKARAAISFARALQTNQWASDHPPPAREPEYDFDQIERCAKRIRNAEHGWKAFFERHSVSPRWIVYEDFVTRQKETVLEALAYLGIEIGPEVSLDPPTLLRQSDELTESWLAEYLAETAKRAGHA
jgi:LPS sulfotransferase NodH